MRNNKLITRVPIVVFNSGKVLDGQEAVITSVNEDMSFWVLWRNWDDTFSRAKLDLSSAKVFRERDMSDVTQADLFRMFLQG